METAGQVVSAFNGRVIKEPRGFIKPIEWILAIFAFATATSFSSSTTFQVLCTSPPKSVTFSYSYPFDLESVFFNVPLCSNSSITPLFQRVGLLSGAVAPAQFYVFVGVMVFLYCLAALVVYMFFDDLYRRNNRFIIGDFIISVVIAALWLISSSAWAQGVSDIKEYTDPATSNMFENPSIMTSCKDPDDCKIVSLGNFAGVNVSIIFGFLNFAVWCGNLWFLFKETPWFKAPAQPPTTPDSVNVPVSGL